MTLTLRLLATKDDDIVVRCLGRVFRGIDFKAKGLGSASLCWGVIRFLSTTSEGL